jgi:hypothetical protein
MSQIADLEARVRSLEQQQRTVEDRYDIHRLIIKSCLFVDLKQLHRMATAVFAAEARLDFGMATSPEDARKILGGTALEVYKLS